jgi:hypothetical protein
VSKDSCESHQAFIDKFGVKVGLLADTTGELCEIYGVWQVTTSSSFGQVFKPCPGMGWNSVFFKDFLDTGIRQFAGNGICVNVVITITAIISISMV